MEEQQWLTARFEEQRPHLRAVAYRMLGSLSDADDAVQEAWIRLNRADTRDVENLGGWLTTVVARISLNVLRSRQTRPELPLELHMPDPVVDPPDATDPEHEALVADAVGLALLVVLETLTPAERLAFVLHDLFAVPFDEIASMLERTPAAARQLASRARRRVRSASAAPAPDDSIAAQREVVDAFFEAGRSGNFEALVAVLHPGVALRADFGRQRSRVVSGATEVAGQALLFSNVGREPRPATINGAAGAVVFADGRPIGVMGFTIIENKIAAIDVLGDPERIARLNLSAFAT